MIEKLIAIIALIISVIAIVISSRDNKKQIMVAKIEEIYELTLALYSMYSTLYELYLSLKKFTGEKTLSHRKKYGEEYFKFRKECESFNTYQDTYSKIFRLNVLSNAYLRKPLKLDILSFAHLFEELLEQAYRNNREFYDDSYNKGFPKVSNLSKLIDDIESKLLDEINMVSDKVTQDELIKYSIRKFRKKLDL